MHLVADSINLIAPHTYNKGVISLGGTSDNIGRLRPAVAITPLRTTPR